MEYQPLEHLSEIERTEIGMKAFNLMYYVLNPEVFEKIKNQKITIENTKKKENE